MAHDHCHHEESDTYYLDQLCMIGITGAFAGICLTLYFFNTEMLSILLQDKFHVFILAVGIALAFIVVVRAAVLWKAAGASSGGHDHHHDHNLDNCGHVHGHHHHHEQGECCGHVHAQSHEHDHDHAHSHDHGPAAPSAVATLPVVEPQHEHDHDHSWAPWRYVVLLVPLMLFLLNLPTKAVPLTSVEMDVTQEVSQLTSLIGVAGAPLPQAALAAAITLPSDDTSDSVAPSPIPFSQLEQLAYDPQMRKTFEHKKVQVAGQFNPYPNSDRFFNLSRLRITCCGADAVQLNVPVLSREGIKGFNKEDWVRVTGRVEFREQPGRPGVFRTVLIVNGPANVSATAKDPKPYIN